MPQIVIGAKVRIYYPDEMFDEGVIISADETAITVDFYDWIERWASAADFAVTESFMEGKEVLVPLSAGTIITDFR